MLRLIPLDQDFIHHLKGVSDIFCYTWNYRTPLSDVIHKLSFVQPNPRMASRGFPVGVPVVEPGQYIYNISTRHVTPFRRRNASSQSRFNDQQTNSLERPGNRLRHQAYRRACSHDSNVARARDANDTDVLARQAANKNI